MGATFVQSSQLIFVRKHLLKEICVVVVNTLLSKVFVQVARMHAVLGVVIVLAPAAHVDLWVVQKLFVHFWSVSCVPFSSVVV